MVKKLLLWGGVGVLLLLFSIVISVSIGSASLPISLVWRILVHQCFEYIPFIPSPIEPNWAVSSEKIVLMVRLPRIMLAVFVGCALSLAGAGFQGILRNPLADPFTLGVASGSSVGAAFLILFGLQYALFGQWTVPIVAFATGVITLAVVLRLASVQGKYKIETVILAGVVVQAFLGSVVSFMVSMSEHVVNDILFWLMGSLQMKGWSYSGVMLPYVMIGGLVLIMYSRSLNLFALGERQAAHLGVRIERTKRIVLVFSTFLTAAAVSVAGVIGFVGLVTPHMTRLMVGPDHRILIPLSGLFGGIYVLWADTLARTLLSPTEIPLGVVTAFIGAPFFAYLLVRHKKSLRG